MIIVSSAAANLPSETIVDYGIVMTPQYFVRDSGKVDALEYRGLEQIDAMVSGSKTHPHSLSASSAQYFALFRELGARDSEILVVAPSRKASGAYDAAVAASKTLQTLPLRRDVRVNVIDSKSADLGTGLITLFCAEAVRQRVPRLAVVDAAEKLAAQGVLGLVPTSFDYLAKSGRASFLKTMIAQLLQKLPVIGVQSGELKPIGTMDKRADMTSTIMEYLVRDLGAGRRVWAAVCDAYNPEQAKSLSEAIAKTFDVAFFMHRTMAPNVYLNIGAGVAAFVYPMDNVALQLTPTL
jgi:DegV family protein with EDD domain